MALDKVSPCFSSALFMFIDSQPKTGTDSVPFYIEFGSNPKRFGRFSVSQIFENGQSYSEPTFQVFKKENSGEVPTASNWRLRIQEMLFPQEQYPGWGVGTE